MFIEDGMKNPKYLKNAKRVAAKLQPVFAG
jgi:hypothetical protein